MSIILKNRGFTLMELMVTIAILAIMVIIAVPDFTSIIQNNTITSTTNDLISSLHYARSEAIKRNTLVSVCATADTTYTTCGGNWNLGWIVFVNPTGGTTINNSAATPLLRVETITDQNITISTSPNTSIATYNGAGFPVANTANLVFTIKATGCTSTAGRQLSISMTGLPSITQIACP